jgi:hypothetical protein
MAMLAASMRGIAKRCCSKRAICSRQAMSPSVAV